MHKKTLIIASHYPLPENVGTNIRTMNFARFFRQYGTVDIVYSHLLPDAKTDTKTDPVLFSHEYFLKREVASNSILSRFQRWMEIRDRPLSIARYDKHSERELLDLIESGDYSYILVRYVINTWLLFNLPSRYRARIIVDFDDILSGSLYESKVASAKGFLRRLRLRLDRKFLKAYEKRCLGFGASLFCSEKDRVKMASDNKESSFVVPNVYNNQSFDMYDFGDGFQNSHNLLFVGGLMYKPNIDGLTWFIESIFPSFRATYPDARLMVVGRSPAPEIQDLCKRTPGVELYGHVPDLKEYYKRCRAVVVPLLHGGGTRIKILEAVLAGRPVLSTPIGAEGLELADCRDILLFTDKQAFLSQYDRLVDTKQYCFLVGSARRMVSSRYSVKRFETIMDGVLKTLD